jgi:hypothetical protein
MLVLSEKIESIDSDCGSRGDLEERQLTEEDIDEYTRLLMSEQMDENSRKKLMMELVALKNRDISSDVKDNQDEAFKNDESCDEEEKGPKEEEGDDDGSSSQENGDEIESDPSSPSTPVLPTDSENELTKCYLKEFKEAKLVGIDNS